MFPQYDGQGPSCNGMSRIWGEISKRARGAKWLEISTVYGKNNISLLTAHQYNNSAGEITSEELERIVTIIQNPTQYKIPTWFLNRQRDITDGKDSQVISNGVDSKLREDLERLKKIRSHRGLRHYWGLRVRGQHTKTTGRRGRTVGVSKKKG